MINFSVSFTLKQPLLLTYKSPRRRQFNCFCRLLLQLPPAEIHFTSYPHPWIPKSFDYHIVVNPLLTFLFSSSFFFAGPAKKRDVRTINSSSSDLGPPSKTVGSNGNGTATVTVTTSNNNTNNQHQQQTQHQRASLRAAATLRKFDSVWNRNCKYYLRPVCVSLRYRETGWRWTGFF